MTPVNMKKISKKYAGLWVALDKSCAIPFAAGKTLEEVIKKAKKKGIAKPVLTKFPTENFGYIF